MPGWFIAAFIIFIIIILIMYALLCNRNRTINHYYKAICSYRELETGLDPHRPDGQVVSQVSTTNYIPLRDKELAYRELMSIKSKIQQHLLEIKAKEERLDSEIIRYKKLCSELCESRQAISASMSNLTAFPYMAAIISDFDTRNLDILARSLEWGSDKKRLTKVKAIREIRKDAMTLIEQYKIAQYQLEYAIQMFPALEDFLDTDYRDLPPVIASDISSAPHDGVRDYLSKDEYNSLSSVERNQLALDRYRESHRKTKWQIGRDYELYIGFRYERKGYSVFYSGSIYKIDDLGRDLIAKKGNQILIIQCKYWSAKKLIHEKHINQLYGTMVCYCFENNIPMEKVHGVLVTNITVSDTARKFAKYLGIELAENVPLGEYPCIKCNINYSAEYGTTKIYHLPFDQQYDACQIDHPGEFMALTVAEAEEAGFRRAYRWHDG